MNAKLMSERFQIIFAKTITNRIKLLTSPSGEVEKVILDVHGLTCKEALRSINNVIKLTKASCSVEVIHGYKHGSKIKDSLWQQFSNPKIRIIPDHRNLGITYLQPVA